MKYKATQKLLDAIAKGTFESFGLTSSKYYMKMYECLVDINKNFTLKLIIDEDAIKSNPDYFEEVEK